MRKKKIQNLYYRKQLLNLVKIYNLTEIKTKLLKSELTNRQIETLLKKNNISIPKDIINQKLNFFNLFNFYKVLAFSIILVSFFGLMPILYKSNNKMVLNNSINKFEIKEKINKELNEIIVKDKIIEEFVLKDNIEKKENTIRLGANTLNEIFKSANYNLDLVRKTKRVKPIYISVLPKEINKIENTKEKKDIFIKIILPLVLRENQKIILERKKLFRLLGKINNSKKEKIWLSNKFQEYKIKNSDVSELKVRMDIIPVSLAIAQAAKETGWGTSRFAIEGNALFGQWTYSGNGLEPLESVEGDHKVMRFNVLQSSVRAYKKNLNTHKVYDRFRKERAKLRESRKNIDSLILAQYLDKYAETGDQYTETLEKIIKQNNLMDFDQAKLLPTKLVISNNI